jgi:hypothetical protein
MRRLLILLGLVFVLCAQQPTVSVPTTASYNALTPYNGTAVTTAATVKSSGGNLYGWSIYNPNSTLCVAQVFNTTSVTLGTTTEILNIPIIGSASGGGSNIILPLPINFSTAIAVAATTAAHGSTTCSTGMIVQLFYQ